MTPKLIEPAIGTEGAREIVITNEEFLIGRGADCDLRINDVDISRHHCLLRVRGQEITLSDLGSSNGTYVDGKRILSQMTIKSGAQIGLGKFRFFLDLGDRPAGSFQVPQLVDPLAVTKKISPSELKDGLKEG